MQSPFLMQASSNEGGDFELPPAGLHPAVLIGLLDLGTHTREFGGEKSDVHKLFLVWELTAENDSKGQPFVIGQDFTHSLNKKAKLRGIVEGFLGRTLNDQEPFDLALMIGKPAVVNVMEGTSGSGKKYVEVVSVAKPMKGQNVPEITREPYVFSLTVIHSTKDDLEVPDWVPPIYGRKIEDEIKKSHEYSRLPTF